MKGIQPVPELIPYRLFQNVSLLFAFLRIQILQCTLQIEVTDLNSEIAAELNSEEFEKEVIEHIQRRVGLDIAYGIAIVVNDKTLVGNNIVLNDSIFSDGFSPLKE